MLHQTDGEQCFALMHRSDMMQFQPGPGYRLVWVPLYADESDPDIRLVDSDGGYFYFEPPAAS